ncbi:MAG TPA: hypothetical protein VEK05_11580 [Burkholderiales bacterium]|nr:hypothetical protein [Burkholderiales bacterium]
MESRRTVWKITGVLAAAGLLSLLARPVAAEGLSSRSEDSFAAAAVSASRSDRETAQTSDDTGPSGADAPLDGSAGSLPPFADIPLAALFLVGICVLGAGLGPHAKRSRRGTEQDTALPESHVGREGRAPN